jgi:hypothetical protein
MEGLMEIWGLPFSTFLAFIILFLTYIISIVWAFASKTKDEDKDLGGAE